MCSVAARTARNGRPLLALLVAEKFRWCRHEKLDEVIDLGVDCRRLDHSARALGCIWLGQLEFKSGSGGWAPLQHSCPGVICLLDYGKEPLTAESLMRLHVEPGTVGRACISFSPFHQPSRWDTDARVSPTGAFQVFNHITSMSWRTQRRSFVP